MKNFRPINLLALSLLLVCCGPLNTNLSITNATLSEDIFYNYTTSSDTTQKKVDGKKITYVMGTLKPQETKNINDIWYQKDLKSTWNVNFRLTIKDQLFGVSAHYIHDNLDIDFDITDSLLEEPPNFPMDSTTHPFTFEKFPDSEPDNAANFYGIREDKDIYVLLNGEVYLADVSERKLVKAE